VCTIDVYDRLQYDDIELRACVAVYITSLAFDDEVSHRDIVDAFQPNRRDLAAQVHDSWWDAMGMLQWTMRTASTCTCTALGHATPEMRRSVLQEYLTWPDGRTRSQMIADASTRMVDECWCDDLN